VRVVAIDDLRGLSKKISEPILAAWTVKEDLMDLLALHGTGPARATVCRLLVKFYESADASGLPEMQRLRARCATTRGARGHLGTHTSGPHSQPRRHSKP
jgi:hypothetical protein